MEGPDRQRHRARVAGRGGDIGNEGVASSVQRTRVSIGYFEYAYAKQHHLAFAAVRNHEGMFVQPGRPSFEGAAASARWQDATDLQQLLIDAPGNASWPITGASFILLPCAADRSAEVMKFFDWALERGPQAAA